MPELATLKYRLENLLVAVRGNRSLLPPKRYFEVPTPTVLAAWPRRVANRRGHAGVCSCPIEEKCSSCRLCHFAVKGYHIAAAGEPEIASRRRERSPAAALKEIDKALLLKVLSLQDIFAEVPHQCQFCRSQRRLYPT